MDRDQQVFLATGQQVEGWGYALLLVLALPVACILTLGIIVLGDALYSPLVPAATAETFISQLNVSVRLELYYTLSDHDTGEYLVVTGPNGRIAGEIGGVLDWAHWSRTSLYLTDDSKIVVLGAAYSDYVVDPSKLIIKQLFGQIASDGWKYLGAFDGGHKLRFIPESEQRECNPTAMHEEEPSPSAARPQSRRERCA